MRLSGRKLKYIIREEVRSIISESADSKFEIKNNTRYGLNEVPNGQISINLVEKIIKSINKNVSGIDLDRSDTYIEVANVKKRSGDINVVVHQDKEYGDDYRGLEIRMQGSPNRRNGGHTFYSARLFGKVDGYKTKVDSLDTDFMDTASIDSAGNWVERPKFNTTDSSKLFESWYR